MWLFFALPSASSSSRFLHLAFLFFPCFYKADLLFVCWNRFGEDQLGRFGANFENSFLFDVIICIVVFIYLFVFSPPLFYDPFLPLFLSYSFFLSTRLRVCKKCNSQRSIYLEFFIPRDIKCIYIYIAFPNPKLKKSLPG